VPKILAMILAGGRGERLYPLTRDRTKPAVPFGAIYRIIDFSLSNCVNSDIRHIYLLTQYKSTSLNRHIELGWNIFSTRFGEFVRLIPAQQQMDESWYQGTADAIFQNIFTLQQDQPDLVLVLPGDHVYKMDYRTMVDFHIRKRAVLTVAALPVNKGLSTDFGVIEVDREDRIRSFQEKPPNPKPMPERPDCVLASMGIYVFDTEVLVKRLIDDFRNEESTHDFGKNLIPAMVDQDEVFVFRFMNRQSGEAAYWRDVGTLEAYWEANMDLVGVTPQLNLYDTEWPIHTYQGDYPPARAVMAPDEGPGVAINALISGGCVIRGGRVLNSVLSPNVSVESGADVKDSVLMERVHVKEGARVRRAILDKDIHVPAGAEIGYDLERDRKRFTVTDSGIVVIPKTMEVD
jgi:glucose-1-phosphate adenylyltransferase